MIARLANSQNSWRGLAPVSQPSFAPKLVALEFLTQNSRRLVFSAKKMAVSLKRASERLLCEGYKWQFMTTSDCCPLSTLKIRQHHSTLTPIAMAPSTTTIVTNPSTHHPFIPPRYWVALSAVAHVKAQKREEKRQDKLYRDYCAAEVIHKNMLS